MADRPLVPALWCIDVEPDEFQATDGAWSGFGRFVELVEHLRGPIADRSGHPLHPTWMLRVDPAIARACGSDDFVFERHGDLIDRLVAAGDTFGIHVHPYRWDTGKATWYSDHTDPSWVRHCIESAIATFTRRFGHPPLVYRTGGHFLEEFVIDICAELGVRVDLTAEPGLAPLVYNASHGSWATAPSTDFRRFPARPHLRADGRLLVVPLSSYDYAKALSPAHRRAARRVLGRPRLGRKPLSMWRRWPSPQTYWDLVSEMLAESDRPYFAWATRTDPPASSTLRRVVTIMEHLPSHPVSARLRFVDPLAPEVAALAT